MGLYEDHNKITKQLRKECKNVDEIAKRTGLDKTVIFDHLRIKELDRNGVWTSENGEFCSYDGLESMLNRVIQV